MWKSLRNVSGQILRCTADSIQLLWRRHNTTSPLPLLKTTLFFSLSLTLHWWSFQHPVILRERIEDGRFAYSYSASSCCAIAERWEEHSSIHPFNGCHVANWQNWQYGNLRIFFRPKIEGVCSMDGHYSFCIQTEWITAIPQKKNKKQNTKTNCAKFYTTQRLKQNQKSFRVLKPKKKKEKG